MKKDELTETALLHILDRLTALEQENDDLRRGLLADPLTGLGNSRLLARTQEQLGWYVFIDLNDFGQINKKHGDDVGDAILVEFGEFLRDSTRGGTDGRSGDLIVLRKGGDEFIVWTRLREAAYKILCRIRNWRSQQHGVTASAGVGPCQKSADAAMRSHKKTLKTRRAG